MKKIMNFLLNILSLSLTCREVDYPFCHLITNSFNKYCAKPADLKIFYLHHPVTIALLIVEILCIIKMILHTKFKFSNLGRKEIIFFFYLLLTTLVLELFLATKAFQNFHIIIQRIFVSCFISLINTTSVCLLIGGFLASRLLYSSSHSIPLIRVTCSVTFSASFIIFSVFTSKGMGIFIFLGCFLFSFICVFLFFILLCSMLRTNNSDIWSYYCLFISMFLFFLGIGFNFTGSLLFFYFNNSYLDSLFFINLLFFTSILMIHKLWDTINDTEEECFIVSAPKWYTEVNEIIENNKNI